MNEENFVILKEFILNVLILLHETLENPEPKKMSKKTVNKSDSNKKKEGLTETHDLDFHGKIIKFLIDLLIFHNNLNKKYKKNFLNNEALTGCLTLLPKIFRLNYMNAKFFIKNKGFIELMKLENNENELQGSLDMLLKIIEAIFEEQELLTLTIESQIKRLK